MAINVKNEIGKLKKVMLHRPGKELEHLVPNSLERLLFDDIPYLEKAQQEHDNFAEILRQNGCQVCYLEDLVADVLDKDSSLKIDFINEVIDNSGAVSIHYKDEIKQFLNSINNNKELVLKTMAGVSLSEVSVDFKNPLVKLLSNEDRFVLEPMPNLYFTRDPFASIGNGASLNKMYANTRCRETVFAKYILNNHPDFKNSVKLYYNNNMPFHIEGGDILNLSDSVIACGISQRTQPEAIEQLAKNIFADEESTIHTVLAFDIPQTRAFMHLDTVFTQVDYNKFTIHPKILQTLRTFEIKKGTVNSVLSIKELYQPLEDILASYLNVPSVQLIRCGGESHIAAQREQWNDGSNTLCIAPGKIVVYERNYVTNNLLEENGITVLKFSASELSRGRGGPRCMSMPIIRDDINL
ncbi:MAG: arginine deiminase [Oscillospiraceae bacterium]